MAQHVPERPDATAFLAAIVESSDDAIISKDLNSNITSWNRAAERLFGYTSEEALGCSINMIIPADRQQEEAMILERVRAGQRVDHFETVRRRKHGSLIDVSLTISPVRNGEGKIIGASKIARDITERKRAHQRQLFLIRELQHRTQNLFAVIQSVINRTLVEGLSLAAAKAVLNGRIKALADAHSVLADHAWDGGPLTDIIERVLASFSNQLSVTGCEMNVTPQAAQHFALTVHELATNAVKYGALSVPTGNVSIKCGIERNAGTFSFLWKESGGPIVMPPKRKGFGTTILIDIAKGFSRATGFSDHVALDYEPDGLKYEIRFPLSVIEMQSQSLTR